MDTMQRIGKVVLKFFWVITKIATKIVVNAIDESPSQVKCYTRGHAYELLHDDKITIAEFVESIKD